MTVVRVRELAEAQGLTSCRSLSGRNCPIPLSTVCGMASQISTTERRLTVLRSRSV